jgi:hypothetical protein
LFPARPTVFVVIMPFGVTVGRVGLDRLSRLYESPAKALDRRALLLVHERPWCSSCPSTSISICWCAG